MGRLHLRNIVLPAVLVSCATFSSFTLPFILSDSKPISINVPLLFEGEIQPVFDRENKGGAIRHIGLAIVSSVGAGLATIEILRRLQPAEPVASLSSQTKENFYSSDQVYHAEHTVASDLGQRSLAQVGAPARGQAEENSSTPTIHAQALSPSITNSPFFIAAKEEFNLSQPIAEEPTAEELAIEELSLEEASRLLNGELSDLPMMCNLIEVLKQDGQTCHIKTLTSDHNQFALHWNQEYYRFFRVQSVREKALAIAQRLSNRGEQVVITEQDEGFVVWVKESSASVELVS